MAEIFGLDFGTTNSLAAIRYTGESDVKLFQDGDRPHPSVVRYHGSTIVVGRAARQQLEGTEIGVVGDFVRSPKRYLGTGSDIHVGGVARHPSVVVADILRHIKRHAEAELNGTASINSVVATVPVSLDGRGRRDYRRAAQLAGFDIHQFVHEPLAALYGYLRSGRDHSRRIAELEGRNLLVFDWGGGTLDLTLCRVADGAVSQIHNVGEPDVGGDRFDERLMRLVEDRHRARHGLTGEPRLLPGARAKLNIECETAKIRLSRRPSAEILVPRFADDDGPAHTLEERITREDLNSCARDLVAQGMRAIDKLLAHADLPIESLELCLATGGMVQMPAIRARLIERFGGPGRVPQLKNGGSIIAEGAAWIASDAQPLTLAKPLEVLHADSTYVPLFDADASLPTVGKTLPKRFHMYCVDPRDGFARFLLARPARPDRQAAGDARNPYAVAVVAVDPTAKPLRERLDLRLEISDDLVVRFEVTSSLAGDRRELELHDLEFGLRLGEAA